MNNENTFKWVPIKRGDKLPKNSIYSCTTSTDGPVYIGGFDNIPGKVNLKNNRIWNIWVRDLGNRQSGEILVMNTTYTWLEISRGELIPKNALYCGLDNKGDRVWVGRTIEGVPGKINCEQYNESLQYTMHNLWIHENLFGSYQKAHILVIDEYKDDNQKSINQIETKQHKLNYLFEPQINNKNNELSEWFFRENENIEKNIKNVNFKLEIGKIMNCIIEVVKSNMGDLSNIGNIIDLIKNFNVDISSKSNKTSIQKSITKEIETNNGKPSIYIFIYVEIKLASNSHNLGNIFNYNNNSQIIIVDYIFLRPKNQAAINKCIELMNDDICKSIGAFKHFGLYKEPNKKSNCCTIF